ncbi:hypothetical protein GCM10028777_12560 [Angustibacter speluncae]
MSFFTAVMASDGSSWRARDVDVEDCADLDDLADLMRGVALGDDPVLCVIEREDGWFALVRVDGEDDPRLFVSDYAAAMAGHYEPVLSAAGDVDAEVPAGTHAYERPAADGDADDDEPTDEEAEHDAQAEADMAEALGGSSFVQPDPDPEPVDLWAGDPGLLSDLGVSATRLVELVDDNQDDPAAVLAAVGEVCGFDDLVEALR